MNKNFDEFGRARGFDGLAMREMREIAKIQRQAAAGRRIVFDHEAFGNPGFFRYEHNRVKAKVVDPSTILPDPALGLCAIRERVIAYQNADPRELMDLDKASRSGNSFYVPCKQLEAYCGLKKLGSGCYSDVYALDDTRVLKIVKNSDAGYERFINKVVESGGDNPHLPKVFYRGVWGEKAVYVLERLEERDDPVKEMFIQLVEARRFRPESGNPYISIAQTIVQVAELLTDLCNDLHSGNVMFRGDCPVVTDPTT